jgi:isocitrate dehydrogenase kinase/phosphatase
VKQALIGLLYDHKRPECAETFYNSVACRVLDRTYYRNEYIFWRQAVATEFIEADDLTWRSWYPRAGTSSPPSLPSPGAWGCRCPSRTCGATSGC